jgi:hypothetical protein
MLLFAQERVPEGRLIVARRFNAGSDKMGIPSRRDD